ncbi:hypothetical protein [Sorangium sp. So ce341]|uniref:hypothetical protein n=1 Tax=Sorangium sp. So ce341 TaxID=3133302 RepID=UPI003F5E002A
MPFASITVSWKSSRPSNCTTSYSISVRAWPSVVSALGSGASTRRVRDSTS